MQEIWLYYALGDIGRYRHRRTDQLAAVVDTNMRFLPNTTDCPSSSNASPRHAPSRHASSTRAIMILRSTIVPAAMLSPSAARWRCASLSSNGEPCGILGLGLRSSARALRSQGPGAGGGASASTRDCRPLLAVRRLLPEQFVLFHKMVLEQVRSHLGYAAAGGVELAGHGQSVAAFWPDPRRWGRISA
jgi:hypothetical protein